MIIWLYDYSIVLLYDKRERAAPAGEYETDPVAPAREYESDAFAPAREYKTEEYKTDTRDIAICVSLHGVTICRGYSPGHSQSLQDPTHTS